MNTPVSSIICTLFEKNYHFGLGALVNSLYENGYRGEVYAGYKGDLPPWANGLAVDANGNASFPVADGLSIYFAYQHTDEMLANIKPKLIEQCWERGGDNMEAVFYIDCDIVVKAKWHRFEEWAQYGVALCEDMNSPVAKTHMLRKQWAAYYASFGITYTPKDDIYVNGGFVGINKKHQGFAARWEEIQQYMKLDTGRQDKIGIADRWNMFHYMDQDALNVTKDLVDEVCILGREAMDFGKFGYVMSHAAGRRKPWHKTYLKDVITTGSRPSMTDKLYWLNVAHPIRLYGDGMIRWKRFMLNLAALVGRFFTRT